MSWPHQSGCGRPFSGAKAVSLVLVSVLTSPSARAGEFSPAEASNPLTVAYRAPPQCSSPESFLNAMRSRQKRDTLRLGEADRAAIIVDVHVGAAGVRGRLEMRLARTPEIREFSGLTCDEVAHAAALVAALAIDARANPGLLETREAQPTALRTPDVGPPDQRAAAPSKPPIEVASGARFRVDTPKAPQPLWGGEIFGEVVQENNGWRAFVAAGFELGPESAFAEAQARFSWWGLRLVGCVPSLLASRAVFMAPCVLLEGGRVSAKGFVDDDFRTVHDWTASAGPSGRVLVRLGQLHIEGEVGALFMLNNRDRYIFRRSGGSEVPVHAVPIAGALGTFGLGWQFE